jgi:hypothetical protein
MMLILSSIMIIVLSYTITKLICGLQPEECIAAVEFQGEGIYVFEWNGFYYAESWCKGKHVPYIRERTRFALTKDNAIELAQWDIRTAHTMASWDD